MENQLSVLTSKILRNVILWAKESYLRSGAIVIIFFIFIVPLIKYLQRVVEELPYQHFADTTLWFLLHRVSLYQWSVSIIFFVLVILISILFRQLSRTRIIREKFSRDLRGWSIPLNSGWTIQDSIDTLGKMLSVTNSHYPGTLKEAFSWYDYEILFKVMIDKDQAIKDKCFTIVIRSENSLNGISFKFDRTHIYPRLLHNGNYIRDESNNLQLPTVLETGVWYKVKVVVIGSTVEIWIFNQKFSYRIPTLALSVDNTKLSSGITLNELTASDKDIKEKRREIMRAIDSYESAKSEVEKQTAQKRMNDAFDALPQITNVTLEYQKGSIGFIAENTDRAYYRDLVVKKL